MHWKLLRLMAPEDAGSGAAGGAPPAAAAPPAQGTPGGVTLEQIKSLLADHATEVKNGVFADLRRSGVIGGKGKGEPDSKDQHRDQKPAAGADDGIQLRSRQRAFDRAVASAKLSDRALERMERDFMAEAPQDVASWVKGYLEDFGTSAGGGSSPPQPNTPPNQQPTTAAAAQSGAPAASTGTPAPPAPAPVPVADLERANVHPNKLSADQVSRLGPQGTLEYVNKFFRKQSA